MKESSSQAAFTIIFLIAFTYLFPFCCGKIDTPVDIRNVLMYPWRDNYVDKKIKTFSVWKYGPTEQERIIDDETRLLVTELKSAPGQMNDFIFKLQLQDETLKKIKQKSESSYYVSFDFKPVTKIGSMIDFSLVLINNDTKEAYVPAAAVSPLFINNKPGLWYKGYFNLSEFVNHLHSTEDLDSYSLCIKTFNKDLNSPASLYIKDFKIQCDDYSKVPVIHNPSINDIVQMFTPFREYFSSAIKKGRIPFWNNYIFGGTEFIAEPQVGYFHPVYFLTYLVFDHFFAHFIILLSCLILGGFGAFLLTRFWGLGFSASLLTSIVYMFQPFNATWMSYEHFLMNSATLPFLMLSYEKSLETKKTLNKYLLISALLLGLIFLSGHLQYIHYTLIFFVLFVMFRLVEMGFVQAGLKLLLKHLLSIIFILGIGIMIGAIVLIPFFPLFQNSHRVANSTEFINANSLPLRVFLGLVFPFHRGFPSWSHFTETYMQWALFREYIYFGFLPFVFSLLTLKKLFKDKLVLFFYLTIIFSILIFTGSPFFFLIKNFIPGFKEMQHYRFVEVYSYCVPFLAGIGFQAFLNLIPSLRKQYKVILITLIIVLTTADLMYYSSFFITWSDKKDYKPLPKNGSLAFLVNEQKKSNELFRTLPFSVPEINGVELKVNVSQPDLLLPYGIEEASGYTSFVPRDIYNLFVYIQTKEPLKLYPKEMIRVFLNPNIPFPVYNFKSKILDLLNVKYFLVPKVINIDSQYAKKVFDGDCAIYENNDYLPRAFFVPDYKVIDSQVDTIQYLDSDSFDPLQTVVLMSEPAVIPAKAGIQASKLVNLDSPVKLENDTLALSAYSLNSVRVAKYEQEKIILKATVNKAGFLILGNNLNHNWKVKVNDKESKHIQANLVQRAVYLPEKGNYMVEFYYFPKLFLIGLFITCFAFLILGLLALLLSKQAKKT